MLSGSSVKHDRISDALLLSLLSVVAHLGIIANPGFFSHDEWERADFIDHSGFWAYLELYAPLQSGPEFGYPVRPIGFLQQGLSALWMSSAPVVVHGVDVLLHTAIVLLLYAALASLQAGRSLAFLAALAFTLSPLPTGAVGWTAASFDQWYTLFFIATCWVATLIYRDGLSRGRLLGLFLFSSGAILSKEAAVVLPGMVFVGLFSFHVLTRAEGVRYRRAMTILLVSALPVLSYLLIRLPALVMTLGGGGRSTYTPSLGFVLDNVVAYFAFPFLIQVLEMRAPIGFGWGPVLAIGAHLALVLWLGWRFSWLIAGCYFAAYFMPLLPVLPLPQPAAHYIHGSAVPLALALAALVSGAWHRRAMAPLSFLGGGALVMLLHNLVIQHCYYREGVCQSRFLTSLPARLAAYDPVPGTVVLEVAAGTGNWTMRRALHDRRAYDGAAGRPLVRFVEDMPVGQVPALRLRVTATCELR